MKSNRTILFALALLFLLIFGTTSSTFARPDSFAPIVKTERKKVVYISTTAIIKHPPIGSGGPLFKHFFGDQQQGSHRSSALGSGFIISADGYIVTNNHVVEKAEKIEVTLMNDSKYTAEVIGKDKLTDLALIKIDAKNLPFVTFGDSSALDVGDWVLAIGNPMGLDHTVTAGILSARGRDIFGGTAYGQFLQTDAAINPGNSGGPLYNMKSQVIGINTAIASGQGLGFSIPSNLARKVIKQLKKEGVVRRGWLGVGIQNVDSELAASFGLPKGMTGVAITSVGTGSPAEAGGIKQGDIIVKFNKKKLKKMTHLQQFVAEAMPNTLIKLKIFRNEKFITKKIKLGLRPVGDMISLNKTDNYYGMKLLQITPEQRTKLNLKPTHGLLVHEIDPIGIAWEKGIRKGDVIVKANQKKLKNVPEFQAVVDGAKEKTVPIKLLINRQGRSMFIALPVPEKK